MVKKKFLNTDDPQPPEDEFYGDTSEPPETAAAMPPTDEEAVQALPAVNEADVNAQVALGAPPVEIAAAVKKRPTKKGTVEASAPPAAAKKMPIRAAPDFGAAMAVLGKHAMSEALSGDDPRLVDLFNNGIRGLGFESLFLQALLSIDSVPVDQNISVIGPHSSCKSWLIWELAKIYAAHGSLIYFVKAEEKWDPINSRAVFTLYRNPDYDPFAAPNKTPDYEDLNGKNPFFVYRPDVFSLRTASSNGYICVTRSPNMEEIKDKILQDMAGFAQMYGKHDVVDPNTKKKSQIEIPRFPIHIMYDSIQGAGSAKSQENCVKGKDPGYDDMHAAKMFKIFLQTFTKTLQAGNPFSLDLVNHKVEGSPEFSRREPGGAFKEAVYLIKLYCFKDAYLMGKQTGVDGTMPVLSLKPHKNAIGAEHSYYMDVPMHIWQDREDTSGYPKRAAFLWEEAFGRMMDPKIFNVEFKKSKTIMGELGYVIKDNKFVCPRLGFDEKHPASPVNFAVAAERDPKFVRDFQDLFKIRRLPQYTF